MIPFSIERPYMLFLILLVIPVVILMTYRFVRLEHSISNFLKESDSENGKLRHKFYSRLFFRCCAWIFSVLALSGITWGTRQIPVQKSGFAVSFVFDISYSMNALDSRDMSRLEATKFYARSLLERMDGVAVSAVLAKGDGFLAVPLTEDFTMIDSLIDSLSPALMTSSGSSLGKGIDCAVSSFPQHSAQSQLIWVFTDGDETDDKLYHSLLSASRFQIPVTLIGFGSEDGVEVLAGDGKTPVKTFLMANKMKNLALDVNKSTKKLYPSKEFVKYVEADSKGSAHTLIEQLKSTSEIYSYELKPVKRHLFFLFLSILSLVISFIVGELDFGLLKKRFGKSSVVLLAIFLSSCSNHRSKILEGAWSHYNNKYRSATAEFLSITTDSSKNDEEYNYALFGLASTYIALEEYDAAFDKLEQIIPEMQNDEYKDAKLSGAVFYNKGIIYERKGDFKNAKNMFKKSILADSSNVNAKINLELCIQQEALNKTKGGSTELKGVSENKQENNPLEKSLFNMIKENEQNQWKKMEPKENEDNTLDY